MTSSKAKYGWPDGHRICTICGQIKDFTEFHKHSDPRFIGGVVPQCKLCRNIEAKKSYDKSTIEYRLWCSAKARAKRKNLDFFITVEDIKIPTHCPVFGYKMIYNSPTAPSIDRINSDGGYTPDNIMVISKRANILKSNMTMAELQMLYNYLCEIL